MTNRIAFQGALGAYSHEACIAYRPDLEPLPCQTFGDVLRAVRDSDAELACCLLKTHLTAGSPTATVYCQNQDCT